MGAATWSETRRRVLDEATQIVRSFPPSTGIWAPVVLAKMLPAMAQTMRPMSTDLISVFIRLRVLSSSTVTP